MSAREFNEWQLYDQMFPFGDEREDWRMGTVAALIFNANRGKQKSRGAHEFMLKPPQTQKQKEVGLKAALKKAGKTKKLPPTN